MGRERGARGQRRAGNGGRRSEMERETAREGAQGSDKEEKGATRRGKWTVQRAFQSFVQQALRI
eukprot:5133635-Pyramimonas_sp.AAC.1